MKNLEIKFSVVIVLFFVGSMFYFVPVNAKIPNESSNRVLDATECFWDPGLIMKVCGYEPNKICDETLEERCPIHE